MSCPPSEQAKLCDFCGGQPLWVYRARRITMPSWAWESNGDWYACRECSEMVERRNLLGLIDRSLVKSPAFVEAALGKAERRIVRQEALRMYELFLRARRGPRQTLSS